MLVVLATQATDPIRHAAIGAFALLGGPGLGNRTGPPVEEIAVEKTVLHPGTIELTIRNDGPGTATGVVLKFAITDRFGSTGQIELTVGAPDENGVRETFILQTPSLNALIYNELEPTC